MMHQTAGISPAEDFPQRRRFDEFKYLFPRRSLKIIMGLAAKALVTIVSFMELGAICLIVFIWGKG